MKHVPIMFFNPGDTFENHDDRAPFRAHIDWLKRSIQD
jgi:hypothetical protein